MPKMLRDVEPVTSLLPHLQDLHREEVFSFCENIPLETRIRVRYACLEATGEFLGCDKDLVYLRICPDHTKMICVLHIYQIDDHRFDCRHEFYASRGTTAVRVGMDEGRVGER